MGLRAVNEDDSCNVSVGRLLLRNLTLGLWPIELYQLIKTGGVRRLGDKLAGTKVIENSVTELTTKRGILWITDFLIVTPQITTIFRR